MAVVVQEEEEEKKLQAALMKKKLIIVNRKYKWKIEREFDLRTTIDKNKRENGKNFILLFFENYLVFRVAFNRDECLHHFNSIRNRHVCGKNH